MPSGFDILAPVYDQLAAIVFGEAIKLSQIKFLDRLKPKCDILVLGGGTGWILAELAKVNPGCTVWYVESSNGMMEKAKEVAFATKDVEVIFIHGTIEDLQQLDGVSFDGVIANFYFDLFFTKSLSGVLDRVVKVMHSDGIMLVSDFVDNKIWWQQMLLSIMYKFFQWCCDIEASKLPDWESALKSKGFTEMDSKLFYRRFIQSGVYGMTQC